MDGRLFMVAVIDILPQCLSSVYLYYDTDMDHLSLGVLSSLSEILYIKNLSKKISNLKYYYLGYYIHNVPKMKYKGQYQPSDLLCLTNFQFVPMDKIIKLVENDIQDDIKPSDRVLKLCEGTPEEEYSIDETLCYFKDNLYTWKQIKKAFPKEETKIKKYQKVVGLPLSKKMAFLINE